MFANENDLSSVKLIDFGLSALIISNFKILTTNCGTPLYYPPEFFNFNNSSKVINLFFNYFI